ncbi:MAG: SMC-Scp complex subunit ScpB, partial [Melioribacteraceae bacterium]
YGTTLEFLKYFGLNKISDLPKPREIDEIVKDADFLEQKRKIMMNAIEENLEQDIIDSSGNDNTIE